MVVVRRLATRRALETPRRGILSVMCALVASNPEFMEESVALRKWIASLTAISMLGAAPALAQASSAAPTAARAGAPMEGANSLEGRSGLAIGVGVLVSAAFIYGLIELFSDDDDDDFPVSP